MLIHPHITCSVVLSKRCDWYYVDPSIPHITCSEVLPIVHETGSVDVTGTMLIHPFHTLPAELSIVLYSTGNVDVSGTMLIHPFNTLPAQLSIVHETGSVDVTGTMLIHPSTHYLLSCPYSS